MEWFYGNLHPMSTLTYILIVAALLFIAFGLMMVTIELRRAAAHAEARRNRAEKKAKEDPSDNKHAWDLALVILESYFTKNLSQITIIFWLSVIIMIAGFLTLIWGVVQSINSPTTVTPAVLAGAGGVITEFLGATFLFIYRSALKQAGKYTGTLERMNSVGMAVKILDDIKDGSSAHDLKAYSRARLVELLLLQYAGESTQPNVGNPPTSSAFDKLDWG